MLSFFLWKKLKKIKLITTDVDGVLTDGRIRFSGADDEIKVFYAKDSAPTRLALAHGLQVLFVTGRQSPAVERRAKQYGIRVLYKSAIQERPFLDTLREWYGVGPGEILYVGDDLNDLPLFSQVGLAVSPRDGAKEVRSAAAFVTRSRGGEGVLAEVIERVMRAQATWIPAVKGMDAAVAAKSN